MIILDANLLVHGWNKSDPKYEKAKEWLENLFSTEPLIGIPWVSTWAFLRVVTNSRIFPNPFSAARAFDIVSEWQSLPNVLIPQPGAQHASLLRALVDQGQAQGPLLSDAVVASITIEHAATLATSDRDFSRFPGLVYINPLV